MGLSRLLVPADQPLDALPVGKAAEVDVIEAFVSSISGFAGGAGAMNLQQACRSESSITLHDGLMHISLPDVGFSGRRLLLVFSVLAAELWRKRGRPT